jgi:protein-S-isoprenylcysteine O-methyltransferase Ste14
VTRNGVFVAGFVVLALLYGWIARRLPREYRVRLRPSYFTVGIMWVFCAVHFGLVVLAAVWSTWPLSLTDEVAVVAGVLLAAAGGALYLGATWVFGFKRQSGLVTTRLVTEGVYRWSRNPILVGWTLVLVGIALARESGLVLLLAAILAVGYGASLPLEEELLGRLYGEAYESYRRRTHRCFGRPKVTTVQ